MPDDATHVGFEAVSRTSDTKDEQAQILQAAAAVIGGAGAVALALNPGSKAALAAVAACGVVAAYLVNNSRQVEENSRALRETGESFNAATESHTTAVAGLVDAPGTGITAKP